MDIVYHRATMAELLLVTNLLHGAVALAWLAGLRRVLAPIPAGLWARLLALVLVLPPFVTAARLLASSDVTGDFQLLRVDRWAAPLLASDFASALGLLLLAGTSLLFLLQELRPVLARRSVQASAARLVDAELEASYRAVRAKYDARGRALRHCTRLRVRLLDTSAPTAAIEGFVDPVLLVSRGMRDRLDAHELEGVIAHELAHLAQGGNRRFLWIWVMRALQAPNPLALIVFRLLVEAREAAADALAAEVTGKPAVLASALLKLRPSAAAVDREPGTLARARARVLRQAELAATRLRVRTLLDGPGHAHASRIVTTVSGVLLAGLLWTVA